MTRQAKVTIEQNQSGRYFIYINGSPAIGSYEQVPVIEVKDGKVYANETEVQTLRKIKGVADNRSRNWKRRGQ